jgi:hypothetical protein
MHYQQGGRKVPNSCFHVEFCIKGRKFGRNAFVQGELAFMLLGGALFRLNFSCVFFADGVEPFCLTLRSRQFWSILSGLCESFPLPQGTEIFLTQVTFLWLLFGF